MDFVKGYFHDRGILNTISDAITEESHPALNHHSPVLKTLSMLLKLALLRFFSFAYFPVAGMVLATGGPEVVLTLRDEFVGAESVK